MNKKLFWHILAFVTFPVWIFPAVLLGAAAYVLRGIWDFVGAILRDLQ